MVPSRSAQWLVVLALVLGLCWGPRGPVFQAAAAEAAPTPSSSTPAKPGSPPLTGELELLRAALAAEPSAKTAWLGGFDPEEWRPAAVTDWPGPVPILMFHEVGDLESELFVAPDVFRRQMDYLVRRGFSTISFAQLLAYLEEGRPLPPKPVLLTFDDGYTSLYEIVYPVLAERGLTATFFIETGAVGRPNRVTWEQLAEMAAAGFEIGSHTVTHPDLRTLTSDMLSLVREVALSRAELEERLGVTVIAFSYPAGKHDPTVVHAVRVAGYRAAVTTASARVTVGRDPLLLPRIRINRSHGYEGFTVLVGP
ncbi:MAG: polysaccharide deacetylase family protein [Bacillota bacterium]